MKTQIHARVLCGTILAFVFSATCWAEYEDYVRHVSTDTTSTPSFSDNAAGKWQTNGVAEAEWPCAGKKFYVQGDVGVRNVLYTSNITVKADAKLTLTFAGDELVLAHNGRLQPLLKRADYAASNAFLRIPLLTILPGGDIYNANGAAAGVAGVCNVKGTSSNPSEWYVYVISGHSWAYCNLDFVGESSAVFYFRDQGKNNASYETRFMYGGDASRFYGTIRVRDPFARLVDNTQNGMNFPGTLELSKGARFEVPDGKTATVANLSDSGGILLLSGASGSCGKIIVTNSFSGTPPYFFEIETSISTNAEQIDVVTLADGASGTLFAADFVLTNRTSGILPSPLNGCPEAFLANVTSVVTTVAGAQILSVGHRKIVYQDVADGSSESVFLPEYASHWSDDSEISPENDYYIGLGKSTYTKGTITVADCPLSYCGTGSSGSMLMSSTTQLTVDDFRWYAKGNFSHIQCWSASSTISGKVTVVKCSDVPFKIQTWTRQTLTLASELCGDGDLYFTSHTSSSGEPGCTYALTGLNTNFAGRIEFSRGPFTGANAAARNADPDNSKYCITVKIADGRNLGGAMKAFDKAGIKLASHAVLQVSGSTAFDEATRGWYIEDVGRINVASGKTVSITNTQITYAGEFRKEGAGTLKLGGAARFTADALATPLEGTNVLAIAGGAFMPTDATCCDGLAVTFAAGTKLLLDAAAEGDLKAYGLYDVKWDSPIAVADGAALPVELVLPEGFDTQSCHRFGICTVSPTAAASMSVDDFTVARVKGMRAMVSRVENLDASDNVVSVTFACNLVPAGFTMTIR